jgi:hypothetical protein
MTTFTWSSSFRPLCQRGHVSLTLPITSIVARLTPGSVLVDEDPRQRKAIAGPENHLGRRLTGQAPREPSTTHDPPRPMPSWGLTSERSRRSGSRSSPPP